MIKAVVFDYDGVLSANGPRGSISDPIAAAYGKRIGWDKIDDLHDDLCRGAISTEAFFQELAARHNSTHLLTKQDWAQMFSGIFTRSQPVYDLATHLHEHGITTAIMSNIYAMTAEELKRRGNYDGFEPVILSCDIGAMKPSPEIYERTLAMLHVGPEEILYIDDREKCLAPAQSLGMRTVLAASPQQIVQDVAAIIKKENGTIL